MTPTVDDLRTRLRTTTSPDHASLEAALDLLAEPCERWRFVDLLKRFRGFHAAYEPALARALPNDAALLAPRRKLALIDGDLRALGVPTAEVRALADAPFAAALCRDASSALGAWYVLEGSTLGGKFISRHLARAAADWLPPAGLRYFDPYGEQTGARWKETMNRLDAAPPSDGPGIEAGAVAAFRGLQAWLTADVARPVHEAAAS